MKFGYAIVYFYSVANQNHQRILFALCEDLYMGIGFPLIQHLIFAYVFLSKSST